MKKIAGYISGIILCLLLNSCFSNTKTMEQMKPYTGPLIEIDSVLTVFSDSAIVRVRLRAPLQQEMENGDREFPKGVNVEFYNERGDSSSVLTANKAKFIKDKNLYHVIGNVVIRSIGEHKVMTTEELFWKPGEHKVYTDKFVTIETAKNVIYGNGLDANEDFTYYKILKPTGSFVLKQQP